MNDLDLIRIEKPPTEKPLRHFSVPVAIMTLHGPAIPEKVM
jgi:hypothetical protein